MRTTPRPARLTGAVALLLVLAVGCGGAGETDGGSRASESGPSLRLPSGATGRCMAPTAAVLRGADLAVRGEVTSLDDGRAEVTVDEWFRGGDAPTVTVADVPDAGSEVLLDLEVGGSYLLAARGSDVMVCGLSGPDEPRLARLYERAFG